MNPRAADRVLDSGVDAQNPWPGLVAFTEVLTEFFHGRDEETEELLRRVSRKNLTVLFGQSGLGKSSLLQAGLFPQLRAEGYLPVPIRLDHAASAPPLAEQVHSAAIRLIVEAGGRSKSPIDRPSGTLWEQFHRRDLILESPNGRAIRPVLVFDQFEELFAIGQASAETRARAATFLAELADFIENRVPDALERRLDESAELGKQFMFHDRDYRVLVCLREDYLPQLESLKQSMPSIAENRMRLTRMNGSRALEAVINPGRKLISAKVGRQVVRFVAGEGIDDPAHAGSGEPGDDLDELELEPSLLNLVCRELNNRRLALDLPQITADLVAGNRDRILQDYYERCVANQPLAVRAFVEDELVTDSGLRENIALERANKTLLQRGAPASAIDDLVKLRLLHLEDRLDIQRVELTHDVLTTVVRKSRDERHQREAALRAEAVAAEAREKARLQRRRLRMIVGGMTVALAIVSGFGVYSYHLYRVSEDRLLEVERQKKRAEAGEKEARNARKESEVVKEVFDAATTPVSEENIRHTPGLSPVQEELASLRLKSLEILAQKSPDDPTIPPKVARAHAILGMVSSYVGSFDRAVQNLKKAVELYHQLAEKYPNEIDYRLGEARALSELGFCYWDDNRKPRARSFYEQALRILEVDYSRSPDQPEVCYEIANCLIRMGGTLPETATLADREKLAIRATRLFENLIERKYREVDSRGGLSIAAYRLVMARFDGTDQQGLLKSFEKIAELDKAAIDLAPNSPYLNTFSLFTHLDKANALVKLGRPVEALAERQAAVAIGRELVKQSPAMSRNEDLLGDALKQLGPDLRRVGKLAEARVSFEESAQVSESLVKRYQDRGFLASQWVSYRNEMANFFEYGTHPEGPIYAREQLLRTLEQTIPRGREMASRFPDHHFLQVNFAQTLNSRGRYETEAQRFMEALPYFLEAVEIYRSRVLADHSYADPDDVTTYLNLIQVGATCANSAGKPEEVLRLAELALQVREKCQSRAGADDLNNVIASAAEIHRGAGRPQEAIRTLLLGIEVGRPAYEKATWHYYLEANLGNAYRRLAENYHDIKDFRNEVLANREYIRLIIGPRYGAKVEDVLDPARPTDEAEAERLRDLVATNLAKGMKRFTVPCDIDGIKYPYSIFISNVPWPNHPLEKQARWLKEGRGGTIPPDVMDSFARLQKIAHENNVSFVDLCVYALGTASSDDDGKSLEIEKLGEAVEVTKTPTSPGKGVGDPFADLMSRLVDQRAKLEAVPDDPALLLEAAVLYEDYGQRLLRNKQPRGSIESLREAARIRDRLARITPTATEPRKLLANTLNFLGKAHFQVKDFDSAYAALHRRCDLLEQLQRESPAKDQEAAIAEIHLLFGELAESRRDSIEALRWYVLANQEGQARAPAKIANMLQTVPQLSAVLPADLRQLFGSLIKDGQLTNTFVKDFVAEVEKSRKEVTEAKARAKADEFLGRATRFHEKALALKRLEDFDTYRQALTLEFDARTELAGVNSSEPGNRLARLEVALELARSFGEAKDVNSANLWTEKAANLGHIESLFLIAGKYEKGIEVKADAKKAANYRYFGHYRRGLVLFQEDRYQDALSDLKAACQFPQADADDFNRLGMCLGKLGQWPEAVAAYTKSIELDSKSDAATSNFLNLLEALIVAEKPEDLLKIVDEANKNGQFSSLMGKKVDRERALYDGFRAMALRMTGKDAAQAEASMREFTGKEGSKVTGWTWDELDNWLKSTKLAPDRKSQVAAILAEMKGNATPPKAPADR